MLVSDIYLTLSTLQIRNCIRSIACRRRLYRYRQPLSRRRLTAHHRGHAADYQRAAQDGVQAYRFAQYGPAQQQTDDRDDVGHEGAANAADVIEQPEVDDHAQPGPEDAQGQEREPRLHAQRVVGHSPHGQQDGKHERYAQQELAAGERQRLAVAQEHPSVHGGAAVADGGGDDRQLAEHAGVAQIVQVAAGENDDAQKAHEQPGRPYRRELLIHQEGGGEQRREQRHAGVQNGRRPTLDVLLRPGDEDERHSHPDRRPQRDLRPEGALPGQGRLARYHHGADGEGAEQQAPLHQLQGRRLIHDHLDEYE